MIGERFGNYELRDVLGQGGMGVVYLAENPLLGKRVALKVLHPHLGAERRELERFFNEARAVAAIRHENIVHVEDLGQTPTGLYYFTMELLEGETLCQRLERGGRIEAALAVPVARQIADALGAAHDRGIIHRDLKPENVFLARRADGTDQVKVLDFGVAKLTPDLTGVSLRTRTGTMLGTPTYMAPEQCEGKGHVDPRTDVYALGTVLFEMVTGRPPFPGTAIGEVLMQQMLQRPERPGDVAPGIPAWLDAVVLKALEKRKEDRFPSMVELDAALREGPAGAVALPAQPHAGAVQVGGTMFLTPHGAASGPALSTASPLHPPRRRRAIVAAAGGLAVAALAAVLAVGRLGSDGQPRTPPESRPEVPIVVLPPAQPTKDAAPPVTPETPSGSVTVRVVSTPRRAKVFTDKGILLGRTPLGVDLPRGDEPVLLRVSSRGYRDAMVPVTPSEDCAVSVELVRRRARRSVPKSPTRRPRTDRDAVLTPEFGEAR